MDPSSEFPAQELVPPQPELGGAPLQNTPPENPPWDGWDVFRLALIQFAVPFLIILFAVLLAQKSLYRGMTFQQVSEQKLWIALCAQFAWYVVVAFYMVMFVEGTYRQPFWSAIRWNWPRRTWPLLVPLGMLLVLFQALEKLFRAPKHIPMEEFLKTPSVAIMTAIFAVSLGPLMEELFFRGFMYPVLARRFGLAAAIVATSVPFALIHGFQLDFAPGYVLVIMAVGFVLTIVRAKTGSVGASLVVHLSYNSTLVLLGVIDAARHGLK